MLKNVAEFYPPVQESVFGILELGQVNRVGLAMATNTAETLTSVVYNSSSGDTT